MINRRFRNSGRVLCVFAGVFGMASQILAGKPDAYDIVSLGPLEQVSAINESAEIVGYTTIRGQLRAFIVRPGRAFELLPLPDKMLASTALDINEWGEIVGTVSPSPDAQYNEVAAVWHPDGAGGYRCQLLGFLPGDTGSVATALNDLGDIVGISMNERASRAVLFAVDGAVVDLSGAGLRFPCDINSQRIVVDSHPDGRSVDLNTLHSKPTAPPDVSHLAFRYRGAFAANAINDHNQIVGALIRSFDKGCRQYAVRYQADAGWHVLSDCGEANSAWDINNHGDVLMEVDGLVWVYYDGVGGFPLSDLAKSDWRDFSLVNSFAGALNDVGQVAIVASDPLTGEREAFLFVPKLSEAPLRGTLTPATDATLRN